MTKEERREYYRLYHQRNRERRLALQRQFRAENRGRVLDQKRRYHLAHSKQINARRRAYYSQHREQLLAARKGYTQRPEAILLRRAYVSARRRMSPQEKLKQNFRRRIHHALSGRARQGSVEALLGCSIARLKEHLEAQFQPGMTWEVYGRRGWHIDHKIPCAAFDLADPKQQAICFHYTNLQPLWAVDNMRKSSR